LRPHPRTSFHHQPEAQRPKIFQLSTRTPADYPIFWHKADIKRLLMMSVFKRTADIRLAAKISAPDPKRRLNDAQLMSVVGTRAAFQLRLIRHDLDQRRGSES
jgi:hypothetical protein